MRSKYQSLFNLLLAQTDHEVSVLFAQGNQNNLRIGIQRCVDNYNSALVAHGCCDPTEQLPSVSVSCLAADAPLKPDEKIPYTISLVSLAAASVDFELLS